MSFFHGHFHTTDIISLVLRKSSWKQNQGLTYLKKNQFDKTKQFSFQICWFIDFLYLKFIDLILFFDLNLKYFRSKIERENFLSTCQIFHYYDFFRLIRIQSSMMSVIKKWNWKDFDYFLVRVKFFTIVIFLLFQSK